jgi:hypothetical protein
MQSSITIEWFPYKNLKPYLPNPIQIRTFIYNIIFIFVFLKRLHNRILKLSRTTKTFVLCISHYSFLFVCIFHILALNKEHLRMVCHPLHSNSSVSNRRCLAQTKQLTQLKHLQINRFLDEEHDNDKVLEQITKRQEYN